jgi:Protein of unknown function (DUF2442)
MRNVTMMHFIVGAVPKDNYILELKFRTGEVRLLDMKPYIREGGVFGRLRDKGKFSQVKVQSDFVGLEWPSGADFLSEHSLHEIRTVSSETAPT